MINPAKLSRFLIPLAVLAVGCAKDPAIELKLATTTSTDSSGLLDHLIPAFEKTHNIKVHIIAVGTGKAIKHGENGDVDVILVHAPEAEIKFVEDGFGIMRTSVMHNDFIILGPEANPAKVTLRRDAADALTKIAAAKAPFVSRGDDSGTHMKEMALWKAAGISPSGKWYMAAGQGMAACLTIADEKQAYVLADRGTYLSYRNRIGLKVLVDGDSRLRNPYSVIAVNPDKHPNVEHDAAIAFMHWLTSPKAQRMIAGFKVDGEQLFHPSAEK